MNVNQKQSRKATILIVGPIPPPYHGVSKFTHDLLNSHIMDTYYIVHLDTTDPRDVTNINKLDLQNIWLSIKSAINSARILHQHNVDIMYVPICQSIKGLLRDTAFIILARMRNAKVVVHLHGGYFRKLYENTNFFGKFLIARLCKFSSRALVLCRSLSYIFEGLVPSHRIDVVPVGIDENYIDEQQIERNTKPKSKSRVLYLSNLMLEKGFFDTIQAIPDIVVHHKEIEFVFAGEFWVMKREKEAIFQYIRDHNVESFVNFTGTIIGNLKKNLLLSSDIFILPTRYGEGLPIAIIEAMAAGLPVITTDQGCIKEMVVDGENGFIIEEKNPHEIAEKILLLLKDPVLRRQMGMNGRARFLKHYTKKRFVTDLIRVFDSVLAEQKQVS